MVIISPSTLSSAVLALVFALSTYAVQAQPKPPSQVARLISEADRLNSQCRGGQGDSPKTQSACDKRDSLHMQIEREGWCWGPDDVAGSERRWIRCDGVSATLLNSPETPSQPGPIGFRWVDDQDVPGLFTTITITNERMNASQIGPTSACHGKPAFWGMITTNYRDNFRPIARANVCWVVDRGQLVLELGQSSGAGKKAGPYRFELSQFRTAIDPDKGRSLTLRDLPRSAF